MFGRSNRYFTCCRLAPCGCSFLSPRRGCLIRSGFHRLVTRGHSKGVRTMRVTARSDLHTIRRHSGGKVANELHRITYGGMSRRARTLIRVVKRGRVSCHFFLNFGLLIGRRRVGLGSVQGSTTVAFTSFVCRIGRGLVNSFISVDGSRLGHCVGVRGLLRDGVSHHFRFHELSGGSFKCLLRRVCKGANITCDSCSCRLPIGGLGGRALIGQCSLVHPAHYVVRRGRQCLGVRHRRRAACTTCFAVRGVINRLSFPSSRVFCCRRRRFAFPISASVGIRVIAGGGTLAAIHGGGGRLGSLSGRT